MIFDAVKVELNVQYELKSCGINTHHRLGSFARTLYYREFQFIVKKTSFRESALLVSSCVMEEEVEENLYYDRMTRLQRGLWFYKPFAILVHKTLPLIYRKKKVVSKAENPLLFLSVTELAEKIRRREVIDFLIVEKNCKKLIFRLSQWMWLKRILKDLRK